MSSGAIKRKKIGIGEGYFASGLPTSQTLLVYEKETSLKIFLRQIGKYYLYTYPVDVCDLSLLFFLIIKNMPKISCMWSFNRSLWK